MVSRALTNSGNAIPIPFAMEDFDLSLDYQRLAALQTMRRANPDNVELIIRELFGAGSSKWTGWDEEFITFVEGNRSGTLLYGSIGDHWHFLIAPAARAGFWICARESMMGKGQLQPQTVEMLTEVAEQKNLYTR